MPQEFLCLWHESAKWPSIMCVARSGGLPRRVGINDTRPRFNDTGSADLRAGGSEWMVHVPLARI